MQKSAMKKEAMPSMEKKKKMKMPEKAQMQMVKERKAKDQGLYYEDDCEEEEKEEVKESMRQKTV